MTFDKPAYQIEKYLVCRRSLHFWPVPVVYSSEDLEDRILQDRAACCVFMREALKVDNPEEIQIEDQG